MWRGESLAGTIAAGWIDDKGNMTPAGRKVAQRMRADLAVIGGHAMTATLRPPQSSYCAWGCAYVQSNAAHIQPRDLGVFLSECQAERQDDQFNGPARSCAVHVQSGVNRTEPGSHPMRITAKRSALVPILPSSRKIRA